jgi:5,10-methylene-tetrahydrofolate dehydrogenase/methenyl tetrahydrofolate cyclohydrolase
MKLKAAEEAGMTCSLVALPETSTVEEVIAAVQKCNNDDGVDGILVQLPLGEGVDSDGERRVVESVSEAKDVDGSVFLPLLRLRPAEKAHPGLTSSHFAPSASTRPTSATSRPG